MQLKCQYMTKANITKPCPGEMNQAHRVERENGAVFYVCPVCDRSNRWVFTRSIDGNETGHLSATGPKSRGMIPFTIYVPPDMYVDLRAIEQELVRLHLAELQKSVRI